MALFERIWQVTVGPPGGVGLILPAVRTQFSVIKTADATCNTIEVRLSNLNATTRQQVQELSPKKIVIIKAGYAQGAGLQTVGIGAITAVNHVSEPPNITTIILAQDGYETVKNLSISVSFGRNTPAAQVLQGIAARMRLPIRPLPPAPAAVYARGFSFNGHARDALSQVTLRMGLSWSIQNGEIQVLGTAGAAPGVVEVLSVATGMIGSPEFLVDSGTEASQRAQDVAAEQARLNLSYSLTETQREALIAKAKAKAALPGWRVRCLLRPTLEPGSRISLVSLNANGFFRVNRSEHTGDSHGATDWTSTLEVAA